MTIKNFSYGITVLALGGVLLAPSPAAANFSGAYDVNNWTTTLSGSPFPAGGSTMDTSLAPSSIAIIGGNKHCGNDCLSRLSFTIAAAGAGSVSFDWDYQTSDSGGPGYDDFGFLLNSVFTQLSDESDPGLISQIGNTIFTVAAGDVFGFWLDCGDCKFGGADVTISNFSAPESGAPVPEPSTWLLFGSGLAGLALWRRKQAA